MLVAFSPGVMLVISYCCYVDYIFLCRIIDYIFLCCYVDHIFPVVILVIFSLVTWITFSSVVMIIF